jgi:hypothetical protein
MGPEPRMTVYDAGEDICEICERVDGVQLAGFDQRRDGRPMLGTAIGARKRYIFTSLKRIFKRYNSSVAAVVRLAKIEGTRSIKSLI